MGKKKVKISHPKGGMVSISLTPSCNHAHKHVLKDISRVEMQYPSEESA